MSSGNRASQSIPSFNERVQLLMTRENISLEEAEWRAEAEAADLLGRLRGASAPSGVFCPMCEQSTLPSVTGVCLWCETPIGAAA